MNPSLLLTRTEVQVILNIRNEAKFKALTEEQRVPAPIGRYKKMHLWCPNSIYKLAERNQKMGISFNKQMT